MFALKRGVAVLFIVMFSICTSTSCGQRVHATPKNDVITQELDGVPYSVIITPNEGKTEQKLFTFSDRHLNTKQESIALELITFINSGSNNVTKVDTYYTEGWMTAAVVTYIPNSNGKGNRLRVALIQTPAIGWNIKDPMIRERLVHDRPLIANHHELYSTHNIFQR